MLYTLVNELKFYVNMLQILYLKYEKQIMSLKFTVHFFLNQTFF
jgi:hypothetical protein